MDVQVGKGYGKTFALIHHYLKVNRAVGHTKSALMGAAVNPCIFITATDRHAEQLMRQHPGLRAISLGAAETRLLGSHQPIVLDNSVLDLMLGRMADLEKELGVAHAEKVRLQLVIQQIRDLTRSA